MIQIKKASLTPPVHHVLIDKGTENPFTGEYTDNKKGGSYLCRLCGIVLFRSEQKFVSSCGWPSFDDEFEKRVKKLPDADGRRTEILCARCDGHLGHIFTGEGYTTKNTRYCVNSLSLDFVEDTKVQDTAEIVVACGCFWGVEYYFKKLPGVLKTEVGYCGGKQNNPTYEQVCIGKTGHLEVIRVLYNVSQLNLEQMFKYFFEIHDFSQLNGQGPDLGEQYLSAIFYYNENELKIAEKVIEELKKKNLKVATRHLPMSIFWKAEEYHQNYYAKTGTAPYCHTYKKIF